MPKGALDQKPRCDSPTFLFPKKPGKPTFGEVYLAEHIYTRVRVAIKVLTALFSQEAQEREAILEDFLREARTLFRLKHPAIVPLLDFGLEHKAPFLVMEYAPNGTVRDQHQPGERVALEVVDRYIQPVASALQYAHEQRLIHRDIKPQNMLLGQHSQVLLSDFGIAGIAHSEHSLATQNMAGTLAYIAPEQIQQKPRPASDQYALAICAYEWLCGTRPFRGTEWELLHQHISVAPVALRTHVPDLPAAVEEVVLHALAKDPQERFATIAAFATAFQQAMRPALSRPIELDARTRGERHIKASSPATPGLSTGQSSALVVPESVPPAPLSLSAPTTEHFTQVAAAPASSLSVLGGARMEPMQQLADRAHPVTLLAPTQTAPVRFAPPASITQPPVRKPAQNKTSSEKPQRKISRRALVLAGVMGAGAFATWEIASHQAPSGTTSTPPSPAQAHATSPAQANTGSQTWHAQNSGTSSDLFSVVWAHSQFVAVGSKDTILTSPDGRTWTSRNASGESVLYDVVWSGSRFMAVGSLGTILTSPDGHTWDNWNVGSSDSPHLLSVARSASQFVTVGYPYWDNNSGTIFTSSDGFNWAPQNTSGSDLYSVTWSGSQFVAVGGRGTILTSPDGRTWTSQQVGGSPYLHSVTWSGSQFVAVGGGGTILTSPDGGGWAAQPSGTSQLLSRVAWLRSQFVAVGSYGTILTSPDGRTWTSQKAGAGSSPNLSGVAWSGSRFVAVGDAGTILTSP